RPWPKFGDVELYDSVGHSAYDAMQVKWERRFSGGLAYQLSYSFGKNLDYGGATIWGIPTPVFPRGDDYRRSLNDHTHLLTLNSVWEVPFGKGRSHLSNLHPVLNGIVGGWQFSTIYSFISGDALSFFVPGNTLGNGKGTRANITGDLSVSNKSADGWFTAASLAPPPLYAFGSSGKGIFDGPGKHNLDTAFSKNFYLMESKYLQFRWEMFNAPNHVNLANPTTTIGL